MLHRLLDKLPAVAGALGAISVVAGLGTYLVTGQFDRQVLILIGIGVALLLIAASYYPGEIMNMLRGRSARYGSNAFAMIVIFVAILSLLNFYSVNHGYRWDLTASKNFTLSQQTQTILGKLQGPVKITAFYAGGSSPDFEDLLKEYQGASNKIQYQFVDPDRMPAVARQYKIQQYGTTVIEYQGKRQDITGSGEQDVTSALLKLIEGTPKKIYFLAGHGEIDIDSFDNTGGDQMKEALKADNYDVAPLSLATTGSVPNDAAVLIIAGAKNQLLDDEKKAISDYLQKGGKALVMVDPKGSQSINDILKTWGIEVGNGVVVDPASSLANQPQAPVVLKYDYSQITKDMAQMTLFPLATSVTAEKNLPKGVTTSPLFESTDKSWLNTDPNVIKFTDGKDTKGPLTMALTEQGSDSNADNTQNPPKDSQNNDQKKPKMRMVVMGNSVFATNSLMSNPALGNKNLFENAVNWLAEDEDLITIRAKAPNTGQLFLTGSEEGFVFYSSALFLPLVVLVAGAAVWWSRR